MKYLPFAAYIACIIGANWAITQFGFVPVGFGLMAPAGVYLAGFTFSFRNLTQLSLGRRWGFAAICIGALLSAVVTDKATAQNGLVPLWIASGVTFALSESADALVWTPAREHGWWVRAMGLGDAAASLVDSMIFQALAFGSWEFLLGQVAGKYWTILPAMLLMALWKPSGSRAHWFTPGR